MNTINNEGEVMMQRAKDLIKHPTKYDEVTSAGSASYVINISFSKDTGEIVEGKYLELNHEKIKEEEKYGGYYSIVTSELKMSCRQNAELPKKLLLCSP